MNAELDEFAKSLILNVRDITIRNNDRTFNQNHVIAKRWRDAALNYSPENFAKVLIPDIVDSTISCFLAAIDTEKLKLFFNLSNGTVVDLGLFARESGELSGWYSGPGGWIEKYSSQRYPNNFPEVVAPSDNKCET